MEYDKINWTKQNILKTNEEIRCNDEIKNTSEYRDIIEPWLSTIFQSDHLSLLVGSGLTTAVANKAKVSNVGMPRLELEGKFKNLIESKANQEADKLARGEANFEDDLRVALQLLKGYDITGNESKKTLEKKINSNLKDFLNDILETERSFNKKVNNNNDNAEFAFLLLKSFLLSFASRTASRERLNIFTTNYDRFIELGCDEAGLIVLDRFKGKLKPIMRNTRLGLDFHYNPPGIRGEPRYVEGVVRLHKIHGSIDWRFEDRKVIKELISFGSGNNDLFKDPTDSVVVFPNSSKLYETAFFPYAELFRDFSSAICRTNSILVTYGYGFGDSHINRIIKDMLTIPSTHLVIISYDDKGNRIQKFYESKDVNESQLTLIVGEDLGDMEKLVKHYLPKPAIDKLTHKLYKLLEQRKIGKEENEA